MTTPEKPARLQELDALISSNWKSFLSRPIVAEFLASSAIRDRRALAMYLIQAYHYTYHTARNQGLVGINPQNTDVHYMRYCFEHALEETGHELMALHDLRMMGVNVGDDPQQTLPHPVPGCELLIAYLYWVSSHGNPVQRLGYSYWAETAYPFGQRFIDVIQQGMKLKDAEMTFFTVHSQLDMKHADDVSRILMRACKNDADWSAVHRVVRMTQSLTFQMVTEAFEEFKRMTAGEPSEYTELLAELAPKEVS